VVAKKKAAKKAPAKKRKARKTKEKEDPAKKALSERQKAFVREYIIDLNGTQAAIRAGYSKKTARQQGSTLLSYPNIQAALSTAVQERAERTEVAADDVVRELAILAFSDISNYEIDENGELQVKEGVPVASRRAVSSIKRKKKFIGGADGEAPFELVEEEIKLWDKVGSLKLIGQHLEMFTKLVKGEVGGKDGKPIQVEAKAGLSSETADFIRAQVLGLKVESGK
jgi:phage terminase small subunit